MTGRFKRLLGDNILVKPRLDDLSSGLIIVPQIAQKRRPDFARIVLIGEACKEPLLKAGQFVVIEDFVGTGTPVDHLGEPHLIIDSEEILAIIDEHATELSQTVVAPTDTSKRIPSVNKPRSFA